MKKELLDYIKSLSLNDKKTLSQKALKVAEESGELAKVVLPFDNADGTTHRFIEKQRVLEESVDVILTAISLAYELGYSHDEIGDMMWEKALKWQSIQNKEGKVEYPIPYEIHITVDIEDHLIYLKRLRAEHESGRIYHEVPEGTIELAIDRFKKACKVAGVKPIVLDLENDGFRQLFTTHDFRESLKALKLKKEPKFKGK